MLAFCFGQRRNDSQSEIIRVHVRGVGISEELKNVKVEAECATQSVVARGNYD
jgi:hypothetical protein